MDKVLLDRAIMRTESRLQRYGEISELMAAPEVSADARLFRRLVLELESLEDTVRTRQKLDKQLAELKELETHIEEEYDKGMERLLLDEARNLKERIAESLYALNSMLLSVGESDEKNAFLEIRCLEGGDAGQSLAYMLLKTYERYSAKRGFEFKLLESVSGRAYSIDYAAISIDGRGAYGRLRHESGIHKTPTVKGRAARVAVAVYPEREEIDDGFCDADIRIDVYHSGGAGGQNINKVETAIRVTHYETGITVVCQDERSQLKNKERALKILRQRLFEHYKKLQDGAYEEARKRQISRSEAVRVYNIVSGVATDESTGMEASIKSVENGEIETFIDERNIAGD